MTTFRRMKSVGVIGVMSGTSLDGLDICYVRFEHENNKWQIGELKTSALDYDLAWRTNLSEVFYQGEERLKELDLAYGNFIGQAVLNFMEVHELTQKVDLIASHGHTVFHQPDKGITVQIGDGQIIANLTQKTVVADFRRKDVELGGQGAPLVPLGDQFLFQDYEACLNLGGIANISFEFNMERIAFDISPCNLPLNKIMRNQFGKEYDKGGELAAKGDIHQVLLDQLNALAYYDKRPPKSLGIEWLNDSFYPRINQAEKEGVPAENILRTIVEHETAQIASILNLNQISSVLVTGGGAFNSFFISCLKQKTKANIIVPSNAIVAFKEALIFAFLGLRTVRGEINTLKSVTGASRDSIGGVISYPLSV